VAQAGSGTTVLTGANTYSGGTTVSAGTLQVGAGGTAGSITGNVTNNGTLAFNRSDVVTFAGNISGTGAVVQAGTGTLILTGASTYSGPTTISGGTTVLVNGSLGNTAVGVNNGGTLGGHGTLNGPVTLNAGATISPGASVGTLTVNNNYTQNGGTGSTWIVQFNGLGSSFPPPVNTPNDQVAVTGTGNTFNLVADSSHKLTISVQAIDGFVPPQGVTSSYTIATTTSTGAILSNGLAFTFDPTAYTFQAVGFIANDFQLSVANGNQLVLTFTPVPEPGMVLAVSAAALGLVALTRRRLRAVRTVPSLG
jgi:autotransporter-associated beta strand protein